MDIQKKQQEVIKELRKEIESLTSIAKNRKEAIDRLQTYQAELCRANKAIAKDLFWYKLWTYLQLTILAAIAVKEAVQLINGV